MFLPTLIDTIGVFHDGTHPIQHKAVVEGANQHYGKLVVSEIHHPRGSRVAIRSFLGVEFKSPVRFPQRDFHATVNPWQEVKAEDVTNQELDASTFLVTAKLKFQRAYTFNKADKLTFGINGDLTRDPNKHTKSFLFAVDTLPETSGTVNITTAAAPDPVFASHKAAVTFQQGSRIFLHNVPLGATTAVKVPAGTFHVSSAELATKDQTTISASHVSPPLLIVESGKTSGIFVSFSAVEKHSAVDVKIGHISHVQGEQYHVRLLHNGRPSQTSKAPEITKHHCDDFQLKEVLRKSEALAAKLFTLAFSEADATFSPIDTTGFVQLPIVVASNVSVDQDISLRLASDSLIYTEKVRARAGTTPFSVPVAPGRYTLKNANFIVEGVLYAVEFGNTLTVAADGSTKLNMTLLEGPNLRVKGFPNYMSFGALADLSPKNADEFAAARVSSIFKYAGDKGDGDPDRFLLDDPATRTTIKVAREVEGKLGDGSLVLPMMISYTCNLSDGDIHQRLRDRDRLKHSFGNLILSLDIAEKGNDLEHPVPAGFIVNPDFLGECQKHHLVNYEMPVRMPLQDALYYRNVQLIIPDSITDTLAGYVLAVNWLVRTIAPDVTFGWQVNLWGGGSSNWIYKTEPNNQAPKDEARKVVDYVKQLKVYEGDYRPDFIAVDRYEADDWTKRAHKNHYFYGPHEWGRFYDFAGHLSVGMLVPVMPWQIPASRAPLVTDHVPANFDHQHWGTGGTYLLGDGSVNSKHSHIHRNVLSLALDPRIIGVDSALKVWQRGEPFDLTQPAYQDFHLRGIFSVMLGGGSTTGVISTVGNAGPWVTSRLCAYSRRPIFLDGYSFKPMKVNLTECERIVNLEK